MTTLEDLIEPLKRAVAVPGTFDTVFPETTDDDLIGLLMDAFAEAQLSRFFPGYSVAEDGAVTPELQRGEGALVVIFGAVRMLISEIRNRKSHIRYEAKGAVFEQDQAPSVLVQLLKDYQTQKAEILVASRTLAGSAFYMADQYFLRAVGREGYSEANPNGASVGSAGYF